MERPPPPCVRAWRCSWRSCRGTGEAEEEPMKPMRIMLTVSVLAIGVAFAGCADFDVEKLDVFGLTKKKPLPGERKDVFPGGVPGVSQGVPPELTKGYQPAEQQ